MKRSKKKPKQLIKLRERVEDFLQKNPTANKKIQPTDIRNLFEELQIYQVELENRNDELLKAQEQLQESEDKYRSLITNIPDITWTTDQDFNTTFVSPNIQQELGYTPEEVYNRGSSIFPGRIHPEDIETVEKAFEGLFKKGIKFDVEYRIINKDGEWVWVNDRSIATYERDGVKHADGIFSNITDRKQAEKALLESEEKYRLLVKNITSVVYKGYKDWSVEFFDEKIELLTGYAADEFNSKRMKWNDIIIEEDIGTLREIFIKALKTDKSYVREYRIKSKTGSINWIEERGQIVCNNNGEFESVNGTIFDKTETKKLEVLLQQAQKLESVRILAGGIAHDFNNFLAVIMGNIELAKDGIAPDAGASEFLKEANKASLKAQELTKQLITFSKGSAPVKRAGSIGNLVKKSTNFSISGSNAKSKFSIPYDLWLIEFDEDQIKHAINNMIANAVESMPDGGSIAVKAENFDNSSKTPDSSLLLQEEKYVKISIQDHGAGISEEHLPMIFDPYFSTKEMGIQKEMGLGLATTYSIIHGHDGHITVESEVGIGTTFTLYLPAPEKDTRELEPIEIPKPERPEVRTGKILLMDDEEMIRDLTKQMLSQLGYDPVFAKNGTEAIELFKGAIESGEPFEAVILDLTIKEGMGGIDTIKKLMEMDPQVRAIASSGYSNDPAMEDYRAYGFIGALPKPYKMKNLSETLNKITKD